MPSLVMPPASQIFGSSQRASARPDRPTDSAYQTEGPNSPRSRSGASFIGGRLSDSTSGAERPSRQSLMKADATCNAPNRSSSAPAIAASSPGARSSAG